MRGRHTDPEAGALRAALLLWLLGVPAVLALILGYGVC